MQSRSSILSIVHTYPFLSNCIGIEITQNGHLKYVFSFLSLYCSLAVLSTNLRYEDCKLSQSFFEPHLRTMVYSDKTSLYFCVVLSRMNTPIYYRTSSSK